MKYNPDIHHRCSIRLHGYDYSNPGAYFVTICAHNRDLLLQTGPVQKIILSAWHILPMRFPAVALDQFVTMPNHVHGIIILTDAVGAPLAAPQITPKKALTLGKVMRTFKSISAIEANKILNRSGQPFWQRNYYEHVIRDENDLNRIRQYIRDNPLNWAEDPDNPLNL